MTEQEEGKIAEMIDDIFITYEARYEEIIFILDRLKHHYHSELDEKMIEDED